MNVAIVCKKSMKGEYNYENDISAKEKARKKSTWIQKKNEFDKWKKYFKEKKA